MLFHTLNSYFFFGIYIFLLKGIKAVIAESYERIHRSNLVGMGIAPLQYLPGESTESLGLTGKESYTIELPDDLKPGQSLTVKVVYIVFMVHFILHCHIQLMNPFLEEINFLLFT